MLICPYVHPIGNLGWSLRYRDRTTRDIISAIRLIEPSLSFIGRYELQQLRIYEERTVNYYCLPAAGRKQKENLFLDYDHDRRNFHK